MRGFPLRLKDIKNQWLRMEVYPELQHRYMLSDWYQTIHNITGQVPYDDKETADLLYSKYGNREIMIDDDLMCADYADITAYKVAVAHYLGEQLNLLYIQNNAKYNKIYDTLIKYDYNPIWNVDGTEQNTITRTNTGTQSNQNIKTGSETDNRTLNYNGSELNTKSGNQTNVRSGSESDSSRLEYSGTEITAKDGNDTNVRSGSETNSNVPNDVNTFNDTSKHTYNDVTDRHSYNNVSDTKSFNNRVDTGANTTTYNNVADTTTFNNVTDTKSFNNRSDTDNNTHTFNSVTDSNTRTDNLNEEIVETRIRQGNIGVTKSQELVISEVDLRIKYDFISIVLSDIADYLLYMC